ncbi:MAG TPA: lipoprotein signal peptidase [Bacteroidia bacterium]|nr:lipoprotein signal peptidase [Bacteroidia bacterium]
MKKSLFIIFSVLLIDQSIKIWIKTHMHLGEHYNVAGDWFYLHFVENPGMAFGLQLSEGAWGKLLLSLFRLVAVAGIGYYLWTLFKKKVRPLLIVCVALIFAGALGNILDSVFYGKIFNTSDAWDQNVAVAFPKGGGYAGFLHGQVVDMFYFPVISGTFPEKFPIWGGEEYVFFRPVFNIADASISIGVFLLIIFQKRLFGKQTKRLSERRILATNIFFGIVAFLIGLFLLLTYFTLFSSIHPLPPGKFWLVFGLAAALGFGMFDMLRRWPRFEPEIIVEDTKNNSSDVVQEKSDPESEIKIETKITSEPKTPPDQA